MKWPTPCSRQGGKHESDLAMGWVSGILETGSNPDRHLYDYRVARENRGLVVCRINGGWLYFMLGLWIIRQQGTSMKTGWPPGLLQDDDRKLSKWFAGRPDARYQLRKHMKDDIIGMVRTAMLSGTFNRPAFEDALKNLEIVAAANEREACAKLIESNKTGANELMDAVRDMEARAIRARGQA
jgi:hypothetical protein